MATPSSSTTTPSPQLRFLQTNAVVPPAADAAKGDEANTKEERERIVQKFLARAELSNLTRGLRTRLSYATYKATHNLSQNTLHDLELKTQSQSAQSRSSTSKFSNNYYNNPATQGNSAMTPGASSRNASRKGAMAPPPPVTASATQSLFSSLLAPPPAKRARTIHNPQDPPPPPPEKPKPVAAKRKSTKASRTASSSQPKSKTARKEDKGKRKESTHSRAKKSGNRATPHIVGSEDGNLDMDVDMKAAATLTSLLLSRPSMSGSVSSPRSSLSAGSDAGSLHSFSHFAQSSTRTTTAPSSTMPSNEHSFAVPYPPSSTPPPMSTRTQSFSHPSDMRYHSNTTPKTQGGRPPPSRLGESSTPHPPTDTEAADLMLFLATSPSPVRPTTSKDKDAKDMAAFRTLSGSSALQGRVLFPGGDGSMGGGRPLRRDPSGSWSSTLTVATDVASDTAYPMGSSQERLIGIPIHSSPLKPPNLPSQGHSSRLEVPQLPTVTPPTPTDQSPAVLSNSPAASQAPARSALGSSTPLESSESSSSVATVPESRNAMQAPPTPGNSSFNLHDFINVSPSPAAAIGSAPKLSSNLRADVGRRLFEEHQGTDNNARDGIPGHGSGLGAGIDLLKS